MGVLAVAVARSVVIVAWLLVAWVWAFTVLFVVAIWLGPDRLGPLILRLGRRLRQLYGC